MRACSSRRVIAVDTLLRVGRAEVELKDADGWTAIMHAVASGSKRCTRLLLTSAARTDSEDSLGRNCESLARERGDLRLAALVEGRY